MADFRVWRIAITGIGLVAATVLVGGLLERARMGSSDVAAAARVEADVRARFDDIMATLRRTSETIAGQSALIDRAGADPAATNALMAAAESALAVRPNDIVALTVYGADNTPLAWSGRPSELTTQRLSAPEAFFVSPGPLGPRLIHTRPALTSADTRRTVVATEWALPSGGDGSGATDDRILLNSIVPVSLRPRYEGAGAAAGAFMVRAPNGDLLLEAVVSPGDLTNARRNWRRGVFNVVLVIVALTLGLMAAPLLQRRRLSRTGTTYAGLTGALVALLVLARAALWFALAGPWAPPPLTGNQAVPPIASVFFRSAFDLVITAIFCLALVAVAANVMERWRLAVRPRRIAWAGNAGTVIPFVVLQMTAGAVVTVLIGGYQRILANALINTPIDVLHFSLHPWDGQRVAFAAGLMALHGAVLWAAVVFLRAATLPWRFPWRRSFANVLLFAAWFTGLVLILALVNSTMSPPAPTLWAAGTAMVVTLAIGRARTQYRHASQGFRLVVGGLALIVPAIVMYPVVLNAAELAAHQLIESQFGPEALTQREQIQERVRRSRAQIDRMQGLEDLAEAIGAPSSRTAYTIWAETDLAHYLLTSSVELYGPRGTVVSRFAFNLPEETGGVSDEWKQQGCGWETYEEVSPFGSEERRLLFAGRGLCRPDGRVAGAIVIRAMLDYDALSFVSARSLPYELLRPVSVQHPEGASGRDAEFVVYSWSGRPIYTSTGNAWLLDDSVFRRLTESRRPVWIRAARGTDDYDVYLLNDRAGIYAVGYPRVSPLGHIINLAEAATLATGLYVLMLAALTLFSMATGFGPASGRALLREIRTSFYRKLFLAFVLASMVPAVTLALVTRAFIATQAQATLEAAAVRTAATAQRVIEDYSTLIQREATGLPNLDDLMVGISRTIDQDVNIFEGPSLRATSERFLFESRLLPERTPSHVYRAIALERRSSFVDEESVGDFPYMVAATPVHIGTRNAILTIPLTLQKQEIEREVDALDRRVLLAAVAFILLGAAAGYSMAERIADPVNRLTRATRRIARGDLTARVLETSSDELRTLIDAFNGMASELLHQRAELERTNRIAAWAEMARQVAHEIKNPLTPIQLSAEHLLRLHLDHGKPLSPVLEECLAVILTQVRILRQIASEFSAFASSPTPHRAPTALADLVHEVVVPYRTGLSDRVRISEDVPADLPLLNLDRNLFARALTNVIENALHAMPTAGSIAIAAAQVDGRVRLTIRDTGIGMDADALQRVFEPYFSSKTTGTGLGLPIAKRNVELNGGTIAVDSQKGAGTTVTIEVPITLA